MLILANGNFKSGSTWQKEILINLIENESLPDEYTQLCLPTFLNVFKLSKLLSQDFICEKNFIVKSHIYHKFFIRKLINSQCVKIFLIFRDLKDAIVSHYFHFSKKLKIKLPFGLYYRIIGRYKAIQMIKYQKNWTSFNSPNILISNYEELKFNFELEVRKYVNFLNLNVERNFLRQLKHLTSIDNMKIKYTQRQWFFRKGEIGDYKNFFTTKELRDLAQLQQKISFFDHIVFWFLMDLRYFINEWLLNLCIKKRLKKIHKLHNLGHSK